MTKKRPLALTIFMAGFLFFLVSCSSPEPLFTPTPLNIALVTETVAPTGTLSPPALSSNSASKVGPGPNAVCQDTGHAFITDSYKDKVVYEVLNVIGDSIKVLDITTMQETVVATAKRGDYRPIVNSPVIYENWVAWSAASGPEEQQVYIRNITGGDPKRISSADTLFASEPSLYDTSVVWTARYEAERYTNHSLNYDTGTKLIGERYTNHLLIYDIGTKLTREIKIRASHEALIQAQIWNDWLAVTVVPPGLDSDSEVVAHNLASGKELVLPQSRLAELQGDTLIYWTGRNGDKACTYNLLTQSQNCFTNGFAAFVGIGGNLIAWRRYSETSLWLYNISNHQVSSLTYGGDDISINDRYLFWGKDQQICYMPVEQIP